MPSLACVRNSFLGDVAANLTRYDTIANISLRLLLTIIVYCLRMLAQMFFRQRYPNLKTAKVVTDNGGESRGYGFVRFYEEKDQADALRNMQGAVGLGRKVCAMAVFVWIYADAA